MRKAETVSCSYFHLSYFRLPCTPLFLGRPHLKPPAVFSLMTGPGTELTNQLLRLGWNQHLPKAGR